MRYTINYYGIFKGPSFDSQCKAQFKRRVKNFVRQTFFVSLMYAGNFVRLMLVMKLGLHYFTLRVNQA